MIVAWESGTAFRALYSLFLSLSTGSHVYILVLFLPMGKTKAQRCWAAHPGSHSQQEAQQGCELRWSSFISGSLLEIGTLFEPSLWWKLLVPSASCRKTGSVKVAWGPPGLPSASSKAEEAEDGVIGGTKSRPPPVKRVQMSLVTPGRQEWKSCGPAVALLEVYPMKTPMEVKLHIWDVLEASRVGKSYIYEMCLKHHVLQWRLDTLMGQQEGKDSTLSTPLQENIPECEFKSWHPLSNI